MRFSTPRTATVGQHHRRVAQGTHEEPLSSDRTQDPEQRIPMLEWQPQKFESIHAGEASPGVQRQHFSADDG